MTTADPRAPLTAAPDPWDELPTPTVRDGPPWHMTDMIAAEPFLAERLLDRLADPAGPAGRLAGVIGQAASSGSSIVLTGCGTSEHAAQALVDILREGLRSGGLPSGPGTILAAQAFELALDPPTGGLVIGISHEGGSAATIRALEASAAAGARVGLITGSAGSPAGQVVADTAGSPELVVATVEMDAGWCHTVGYLSPILAGAAIADELAGRSTDAGLVRELLATGAADESAAEGIAAILAECRTIVTVGSGADRPAARELALKIEEAAWLPTTMRDLETFLHGHLPAMDETTGLVLLLTDRDGRAARIARARHALAAAQVVGIKAAAIVGRDVHGQLDGALTPAGRLRVDEVRALPAPLASIIGTATPLQLLTERIARARGTNPDLIRRDDPTYRAAAEAAG
ncbi:MAG TPA: SIS domain-containing protein [Candidatus Limnocylindrales bacterium]|nr:SIS domain-containing protein [Candidatus Limnocylindrales bacterium]